MLTAVVTRQGVSVSVEVLLPQAADEIEAGVEEELDEGPSPIAPEVKELVWGGGAFVVFAVLMRLYLYPKLKKGMNDRCVDPFGARAGRLARHAAAQAEVADYQAQLAVKAEAAARDRCRSPAARRRADRPPRGGERAAAAKACRCRRTGGGRTNGGAR